MSILNLKKLENKQLAFLGLGVENLALVKFLLTKKIQADFTICDFRSWENLGERFQELNQLAEQAGVNLKWQLGKLFNQKLYQFQILFRSPGWTTRCPGIKEAIKKQGQKIILTSAMELFLQLAPTKNVVGVTGTKGKGTTSTLIAEIIKAGKKRVWLGGNIGVAPFNFLGKLKPSDWVVLELSSFQLQGMNISPRIAVITNFVKEHLAPADPNNPNYHLSMKEYWEAKANVFLWQKRGGAVVVNKKIEPRIKKCKLKSKVVYFAKADLPTKLIGQHNQENIAAAVQVANLIGIKAEVVKKAVAKFAGLEHRLEFVRELNHIKYYNDTFATTPEATITALRSFDQSIVLLAGGADKKSDFKQLAKVIKTKVKFVVLLKGEATLRLGDELMKAGMERNKLKLVDNLKTAVKLAVVNALPGEIVLLSTACASFGMFKNYKERGRLFKKEVNNL